MKNEIGDLIAITITSERAVACIWRAKGYVFVVCTRKQVKSKERGNYRQGWGRERLKEQQTDFTLQSSFMEMATRLFLTSASLNFCTFLYNLERCFTELYPNAVISSDCP